MSIETLRKSSELEALSTPIGDKILETIKTRRIEACHSKGLEFDAAAHDAEEILLRGAFTMFGHAYAQVKARYEQDSMEDAARDQFLVIYRGKLEQSIPEEVRSEFDEYTYEDVLEEYAKLAMHQAEMDIMLAPVIDTITLDHLKPSEEDIAQHQLEGLESELKELRRSHDEIERRNVELLGEVAALKRQLVAALETSGGTSELPSSIVEHASDDQQRTLGGQALGSLMGTI